jgi:hypothetical protein
VGIPPGLPPNTLMSIRSSRSSPTTTRAGDAPFQPLAALHPVPTWEDTKLLLVHALGHVRDLIPRSIRVIAIGPLAPFVHITRGDELNVLLSRALLLAVRQIEAQM